MAYCYHCRNTYLGANGMNIDKILLIFMADIMECGIIGVLD